MNRLILLVLAAAAVLLLIRRRSTRPRPEVHDQAEPALLPEASAQAANETAVVIEPEAVAPPDEKADDKEPATEARVARKPAADIELPLPEEKPAAPDLGQESPTVVIPMEPAAPVASTRPSALSPEGCAARLQRLEEQLRIRVEAAIADGDDPQRDRLQRALVLLNERLVHLADSCAEEADSRQQALTFLDVLAHDRGNSTAAAAALALRANDTGPAEDMLAALSEQSDAVAGPAAFHGGRLADSRVDLERALNLYRRAVTLEPDNPAVLLVAGRTARSLYKYHEAVNWLEQYLHLCAHQSTDDPVTLALAQRELGYTYVLGGQQRQAGPLYKESMSALARHLGLDHAEMAISWQQIAELQEMQGEYDKAASLYRKALAILEKQRGPDDPTLLPLLDRLAALCVELEMEPEAVRHYQHLVRIRERVLRPDHPQLALSLNNLAEAYRLLGRYPEAEASYRRSLAVNEAIHGPDHPAVAAVLQEIAKLCASQDKTAEAEGLRERANGIFRRSVEAADGQTGQEFLTLDL
ncbi:MAG: tetratricopeptide repeat protein [Desulfobulbus sp.]|nr:tetratricopeptide repeat protein [Desulfobulbus sp.]